jgi:CRP/FNR family transcriptional regulator, cyclic AMP receptor protein
MNPARLKDVPFFSSMSEQDLAAVAQQADEISVAAGTALAREGDLGEGFFVIESGTAEVTRGGAPVAELGAGDFFGEIALIREERRTATVTATSPMVLIVLTGSSFRSLDGSRPEIRERVSKALAERRSSVSR